jgi:hypothetical protein
MYKASFDIVNPKDLKYNIWFFSIAFFCLGLILLSFHLNLVEQYFYFLGPLLAVNIILLKFLRFFFRDKYKTGQINLYSDEIEIETMALSKKTIKPKQIIFHFDGCFGENNSTGLVVLGAFNSGRKNVISIIDAKNETYQMNIYLHNDFEKNKLYAILRQLSGVKGITVNYI